MRRGQTVTLHLLRGLVVGVLILLPPSLLAESALGDSTADHMKFEALKKTFENGPAVTKACLSCHTEAAKQIHKTKHWNWRLTHPDTGEILGKREIINSFCGSIESKEQKDLESTGFGLCGATRRQDKPGNLWRLPLLWWRRRWC